MPRLIFFVLLLLPSLAVAAGAEREKPIRIVLVGDSTVATYAKPPADKPDLTGWGQENWQNTNEALDAHDMLPVEQAWRLVEAGKRLGVEVTFWAIDSKYDWSEPSRLCPWPFERAYISSDMRVVPCCMIANPEILDMGDARTLTKVWNSERMAEFRQDHLDGRIPAVCKCCYKAVR